MNTRHTQKTKENPFLVYIVDTIAYTHKCDLEDNTIESLWIELLPSRDPHILISTVYRHPDTPIQPWLDDFECHISNAYLEGKDMLIMGDLNVDLLSTGSNQTALQHCMDNYQLQQVIMDPTRVTETNQTLIDHVWTTDPNKVR